MNTKIFTVGLLLTVTCMRTFALDSTTNDLDDLFNSFIGGSSTSTTTSSTMASGSSLFSDLSLSQICSSAKPNKLEGAASAPTKLSNKSNPLTVNNPTTPTKLGAASNHIVDSATGKKEVIEGDLDDLFDNVLALKGGAGTSLFSDLSLSMISSPQKPTKLSLLIDAGISHPTPGQLKFVDENVKYGKVELRKGAMRARLGALGINNPTDEQITFAIELTNLNLSDHELVRGAIRARLIVLGINNPTVEQVNYATDSANMNKNVHELVSGTIRVRLIALGINNPVDAQLQFATDPANLNANDDELLRGAMKARLVALGINTPTVDQVNFATNLANLNQNDWELVRGVMRARLVAMNINVPRRSQLDFATNPAHLNDSVSILRRGVMIARLIAYGIHVPTPEQINYALTHLNEEDNNAFLRGAMEARLVACGIGSPSREQIEYAVAHLNDDRNTLVRGAMEARLRQIMGAAAISAQHIQTAIDRLLNANDDEVRAAFGIVDLSTPKGRKIHRTNVADKLFFPDQLISYHYGEACKYFNIGINSTEAEVKGLYRKLVLKYHPDRNGDEEIFKEVDSAYKYILLCLEQKGKSFIPGDIVMLLTSGW